MAGVFVYAERYFVCVEVRVGKIHDGLAALISPTSIHPDSRVMTMGAVSELFREVLAKLWFISIEVVVELFMAVSFHHESGLTLHPSRRFTAS